MDGNINVCFGITKTTERAVYVTNKMYNGWIPKKLCTINGYIVSTVEKWFAWKNGFYTPTVEELEKERKASQNDLFTALVAEQFPDGKAQAAFKESWEIGERNGTHLKINRDKVIAGFLAKSRLAPRLVHHFALKPEALERIAEIDDDDRKKFELFSLEQRMAAYLADKARAKQAPKKPEKADTTEPSARQILGQQVKSSVIGRQTAPGSANPNKGLSDKDIENIVNRNRFGGLGFRG